ncbi:Gustatory receptor 116, partial [Hyalella azteca]
MLTRPKKALSSPAHGLQRWFTVLKFMGLYLDLKNVVGAPSRRGAVTDVPSNATGGGKTMTRAQSWLTDGGQQKDASCFKNVGKLAWYITINAVYIACSAYICSTRDFSDGSMSGIFLIVWYFVSPITSVFCVIKCKFVQRAFTKLFELISFIYNSEDMLSSRSCKLTSNSCLLLGLAVTRATHFSLIIKNITDRTVVSQFEISYLIGPFSFYMFWALNFTLILSFNFFVGVLKKNIEQTSAKLAERGPSLRAHDAVAPTYPATPGSVTSSAYGEASSATEFLREIERQLLLIDQAIKLITHVYSSILIFLSISYLTDLFFAIYLLMTMQADDSITMYVVYITEALFFLFLTHNPADALSDA